MKTYKEFVLDEAVARFLVKGVARQLLKNKGLAKAAQRTIPSSAPKNIKFGKVFHGTNTTASSAISKGGYRTDKNVTRQMMGPNTVSTSSDNYTAAMYGMRAANKYGGKPAMRQLRVPQSVMKDKTTFVRQGIGDYSGKGYKMTTLSPQQANKFDVTDKVSKSKYDLDLLLSPEKRKELLQRVQKGLKNPAGRRQLRGEIRQSKEASMNDLYRRRNNPVDPNTSERLLQGRQ